MLRTLSSVVRTHAKTDPSALALLAPQQAVAWTYGELEERALKLAKGLRELGYQAGSIAVSTVPNTAENLLLHLGLSHLGAALATVKDASALAKLRESADVKGAIVAEGGPASFLAEAALPLPAVVAGGVAAPSTGLLTLDELLASAVDGEAAAATEEALLGSYGGAKLTHGMALALGEAAAAELVVTRADRACVSITLCHAFGIGSAVSGTLLQGGTVVLPAVGGIRGCGDPAQRASVTLEVLQATAATLLYADSHTLKALPEASPSELPSLRGGVVKIGSGSDFLGVTSAVIGGVERELVYGGKQLLAMGKKA